MLLYNHVFVLGMGAVLVEEVDEVPLLDKQRQILTLNPVFTQKPILKSHSASLSKSTQVSLLQA